MKNNMIKTLLTEDSHDSIVRVLRSWRLWVLGAIIGAVLASGLYLLFPPPYRAAAVVVVDHNLEEVWDFQPYNTFYFLGRETRKLEQLAWSDEVLQKVADQVGGVTVRELRDDILSLSHPSDGGWDFYADHRNKQRAEEIASAWGQVYVDQVVSSIEISAELLQVREEINQVVLENPGMTDNDLRKLIDRISPLLFETKGITPFIEIYLAQGQQLSVTRSISMAIFTISGSLIGALGFALTALIFLRAEEKDEFLAE